ncbi:homeobox-like protein HDP1 isoform X1 [Mya arenaria]|uniref:homeobox-like protein HDP1 isoform X1 n=1 Tax=Mya arenaria TaxID=6604 RepID=UPI0022E780D6|nr:homeobox-like protein HDP1 isoform X1 [Mya arenaria]
MNNTRKSNRTIPSVKRQKMEDVNTDEETGMAITSLSAEGNSELSDGFVASIAGHSSLCNREKQYVDVASSRENCSILKDDNAIQRPDNLDIVGVTGDMNDVNNDEEHDSKGNEKRGSGQIEVSKEMNDIYNVNILDNGENEKRTEELNDFNTLNVNLHDCKENERRTEEMHDNNVNIHYSGEDETESGENVKVNKELRDSEKAIKGMQSSSVNENTCFKPQLAPDWSPVSSNSVENIQAMAENNYQRKKLAIGTFGTRLDQSLGARGGEQLEKNEAVIDASDDLYGVVEDTFESNQILKSAKEIGKSGVQKSLFKLESDDKEHTIHDRTLESFDGKLGSSNVNENSSRTRTLGTYSAEGFKTSAGEELCVNLELFHQDDDEQQVESFENQLKDDNEIERNRNNCNNVRLEKPKFSIHPSASSRQTNRLPEFVNAKPESDQHDNLNEVKGNETVRPIQKRPVELEGNTSHVADMLSDSGFIEMFSNSVMANAINRHDNTRRNYPSFERSGVTETFTSQNPGSSRSYSDFNLPRPKTSKDVLHSIGKSKTASSYSSQTAEYSEVAIDSSLNVELLGTKENDASANKLNINDLHYPLLVQIFQNFNVYELLRVVCRVCTTWYNVTRDADLWLAVNLTNQHRVTDENFLKLVRQSNDRIQTINLTDCRLISSYGVLHLLNFATRLTTLKLIRCFDIMDSAFESAERQSLALRHVYLDGCCKVTDDALTMLLPSCPELCTLHLNQCPKITDRTMLIIARYCSKLQELQLDHCSRVTDAGLSSITKSCTDMRNLNLMSCGISDDCGIYLAKLPKLTNLDLSNLPRLTPDTVTYISSHCKNIRCLNLSLNAIINDDCLEALSKNLPGLWRLYCVSCCISDRGIAAVATNCPFLKCLDIGWCQDITDIGVKSVTSQCAYLEYLGLIRCDKVTLATMEQLVLKYPRVNFSTFILESRRLLERARREGYVFDVEISK